MKHAQPVRAELKMRTVFNLLGPLTNPAGRHRAAGGAPSEHAAELMAGALAELGLARGFVVHGSDGLDEITTTGPTLAFEIRGGQGRAAHVETRGFRRRAGCGADLKGGDKETNAAIAHAVLRGRGPQRDIVLVNAAAALVAAGKARDFLEGMEIARAVDRFRRGVEEGGELARFRYASL